MMRVWLGTAGYTASTRAASLGCPQSEELRRRARHRVGLWMIVVMAGFCAVVAQATAEQTSPARFVGHQVCLSCHTQRHGVRACSLRPIPAHRESYRALSLPVAEHVAALCGVFQAPTGARLCLGCHSTGADAGRRWMADSFDPSDGVQCEACHGPGSLHVVQFEKSTKNAPTVEQKWIAQGDRAQCAYCHAGLLSHREVFEEGFRLAEADRLYKTPVNLTLSPDGHEVYVVCEHSDSVVVVDVEKRKVIGEITVGRRPRDVAVSPDGATIYVSNRMSNSVSAVDVRGRQVTAEIAVGAEPHGLYVDGPGRRLYVLNTGQDAVSVIDLDSLREVKRLAAGAGPWSCAWRPQHRQLYVTNVRPNAARFRDPPVSEISVIDLDEAVVADRRMADGTNMLQGIALVPGTDTLLFTMVRTKNLLPLVRVAQGWVMTNGLGIVRGDGRIDQVLLDEPNAYFPDPGDVAVSPDGRHALVTSGGSDRVALVDVRALLDTIDQFVGRKRTDQLANRLDMSRRFVVKRIAVGANPRAVAFARDGRFAYVANALDDTLTVVETADYRVVATIPLGGPTEITQIRKGERLFHSADITFGQQFSCRSCHPDGHINGLTFDIESDGLGMHPVDNRTLRGILDTAPYKWEGSNPSLERQCGARLAVFFTRLEPYKPDELAALVRYMCTIELPPNPHRRPDGLTPAQRRGKAVFERTTRNDGVALAPDERCIHCHHSAYFTSRMKTAVGSTMWFDAPVDIPLVDLFDADALGELGSYYFIDAGTPSLVLDVPHLRNIYDSPPYLHNGSARTLEEIWTRFNMVNRHGMTGDLTRQQLNDLIAYLKAL